MLCMFSHGFWGSPTQIDEVRSRDTAHPGCHGTCAQRRVPQHSGVELCGDGIHNSKGSRHTKLPQHLKCDGNTAHICRGTWGTWYYVWYCGHWALYVFEKVLIFTLHL